MFLSNGWTGGQYSLYRIVFGIYLCVHFLQLAPWGPEVFSNRGAVTSVWFSPFTHLFPNVLAVRDDPFAVIALLLAGVVLSALLAVGWHDRLAAVGMWYIWACLFGRNPLISNPGLPYVGLLLVVHALMPPAPYLSWAARGRSDPRGGWTMPPELFALVWILMAVGYTYSGYTKLISPSWLDGTALTRVLNNPLARPGPVRDFLLWLPPWIMKVATWSALALELTFAPLALFRVLRSWIWGLMLLMHLNLILVIDFADLSLGMVMLHLFTFDPGWIKPGSGPTETIFYDGHCGLCHRGVRFVLAEDPSGDAFRFAPLQGEKFQAVAGVRRVQLPDSIVVQTATGALLVRSAAVRYICGRLGGIWRIIACAAGLLPARLWDFVYDLVAGQRARLFDRPPDACPLVPADLRQRFDL